MIEILTDALDEAQKALSALRQNQQALQAVVKASELIVAAFQKGGHVYSCGNGGSMCDAMHFAEEMSGRFRENRPALGAMAMSDGAYLTCVGNDYGYDQVFSRFVEAQGRAGDVLLGISTSGKSGNVIKAAEAARQRGMKVITLTGRPDSAVGRLADIDICTPAGRYADRVQELHIKIIHSLIEMVEHRLFASGASSPL